MILSIFKFSVVSENKTLATVIYLIISFLVTAYGLFLKLRVVSSEKEPPLNISGKNVSNLEKSIKANPLFCFTVWDSMQK